MTADVYAVLTLAWARRMAYIAQGEPEEGSAVWGEAYHTFFPDSTTMISWVFREDGGADCIVAGTMYFEDTATRTRTQQRADEDLLVRVPK